MRVLNNGFKPTTEEGTKVRFKNMYHVLADNPRVTFDIQGNMVLRDSFLAPVYFFYLGKELTLDKDHLLLKEEYKWVRA